jgi:glycosyltransferase involved in cell wall biosynthesis
MRIAIATTARFHVLDLARELTAAGHEVVFYSYLPGPLAVKFGLGKENLRGFLPWVFPLVFLNRRGPLFLRNRALEWAIRLMDFLVERNLEPCDLLIAMSGLFIRSSRKAKEKYGASLWIERGSSHVLFQKEIFEKIARLSGKAWGLSDFTLKRELESYSQADLIVVISQNSWESFRDRGILPEKLFLNQTGVDLEMFPPTPAPDRDKPTLLYVGAWSYRKGCDLLGAMLEQLPEARLIHVGSPSDCPYPLSNRFLHFDSVPQWKLREYYAQAHVFVLASREEGFGMVLSQALACGLTLVATHRTGGRDLLEWTRDPHLVHLIPPDDPEALRKALKEALEDALKKTGLRALPDSLRHRLSWKAYGERYGGRITQSFPRKAGPTI